MVTFHVNNTKIWTDAFVLNQLLLRIICHQDLILNMIKKIGIHTCILCSAEKHKGRGRKSQYAERYSEKWHILVMDLWLRILDKLGVEATLKNSSKYDFILHNLPKDWAQHVLTTTHNTKNAFFGMGWGSPPVSYMFCYNHRILVIYYK